MKTEKEIRHAKELFQRAQSPDCQCINCDTWQALVKLLNWVLGDDPEEERRMERVEALVAERERHG